MWVLIHMSSVGICVISRVHPADQPAVLHGKIFNVGHSAQTFQTHLFKCAMLIGIDFCHFILLSVAFTMARIHNVNTKQNLLASFPCTLFR